MKLCDPHWEKLRAAIAERGLDRFVSNNGQQAAEKMAAQLERPAEKLEGFDPLLNANFAIWNNALQFGGVYLLGTDDAGNQYCPICEAVKNVSPCDNPGCDCHTEDWWFRKSAEEQLQRARELGLLPVERVQ